MVEFAEICADTEFSCSVMEEIEEEKTTGMRIPTLVEENERQNNDVAKPGDDSLDSGGEAELRIDEGSNDDLQEFNFLEGNIEKPAIYRINDSRLTYPQFSIDTTTTVTRETKKYFEAARPNLNRMLPGKRELNPVLGKRPTMIPVNHEVVPIKKRREETSFHNHPYVLALERNVVMLKQERDEARNERDLARREVSEATKKATALETRNASLQAENQQIINAAGNSIQKCTETGCHNWVHRPDFQLRYCREHERSGPKQVTMNICFFRNIE